MANNTTRRTFIKHVGYAGATLPVVMPTLVRAQSANNKLNCAFVGTGGRAGAHTGTMHKYGENCVAFAEVDKGRWGGVHGKKGWNEAKGYTDWRKVFENHEKEIDVVFVAVPDHSHFSPSMTAVSLGKHCYTEKPLTWSFREAILLAKAYEKNTKVVTQMGNQGHAGQGWRIAGEFMKSVLGDITEFITWTNRPVWPQGGDRPKGEDPVPDSLDWDAWIGAAPMRPFKKGVYHAFKWRGVADFGCGAIGDMACHTTDGLHAVMEPDFPTAIEPTFMTGPVKDQYPSGAIVKYHYPAKDGKSAFTATWREGRGPGDNDKNLPETPEEMKADGRKLPRTGNLVIGTKGKMLVTGDYWNSPRLIPESFAKEIGKPDEIYERSPGHHKEFVMACKGEKPREFSRSNWGYARPMTAKIALGNIAMRAGKHLECDPKTGEITNDKSLNELLWREPRKGWGPLATNV